MQRVQCLICWLRQRHKTTDSIFDTALAILSPRRCRQCRQSLKYQAMRAQNPEPKVVAVITEVNALNGRHRVRVRFKDHFHALEEDFSTLEEVHAAGKGKLHELGYNRRAD